MKVCSKYCANEDRLFFWRGLEQSLKTWRHFKASEP